MKSHMKSHRYPGSLYVMKNTPSRDESLPIVYPFAGVWGKTLTPDHLDLRPETRGITVIIKVLANPSSKFPGPMAPHSPSPGEAPQIGLTPPASSRYYLASLVSPPIELGG